MAETGRDTGLASGRNLATVGLMAAPWGGVLVAGTSTLVAAPALLAGGVAGTALVTRRYLREREGSPEQLHKLLRDAAGRADRRAEPPLIPEPAGFGSGPLATEARSAGRRRPEPLGSRPGRRERRAAAARAKAQRRTQHAAIEPAAGSGESGAVAKKFLRGAWAPTRKLWRWKTSSGMGALGKTLALPAVLAVGAVATVPAAAARTPSLFWKAGTGTGQWLWRRFDTARAARQAFRDPHPEQYHAIRPEPTGSGSRATQGEIVYTPTNMDAIAEAIRNTGGLDAFDGVSVASWAQGVAKVLDALAEAASADLDRIREQLPQEDGGESLARLVQSVAANAELAGDYANQWEDTHQPRLQRQREPLAGEENWDTAAVQR